MNHLTEGYVTECLATVTKDVTMVTNVVTAYRVEMGCPSSKEGVPQLLIEVPSIGQERTTQQYITNQGFHLILKEMI